jgi:hypothetical protein
MPPPKKRTLPQRADLSAAAGGAAPGCQHRTGAKLVQTAPAWHGSGAVGVLVRGDVAVPQVWEQFFCYDGGIHTKVGICSYSGTFKYEWSSYFLIWAATEENIREPC